MGRQLLSAKQVATRLSVTPRTVWRWVAEKRLPEPVRLSRKCVRWWNTDVEYFLQELSRE
jgi:predicted DNA-binding transcriptional regulator AlpA